MKVRIAAFGLLAAMAIGGYLVSQRGDGEAPILGTLGPTPGPSSQGHVEAKRAYLDELAERTPQAPAAGLASLNRLVSATRLVEITGEAKVTVIFTRLPGAEPAALRVSTTVADALGDAVTSARAAIDAEIESLQGQEGADAAIEERRRWLVQLDGCQCVYAAAIEDVAVAALLVIQGHEDVRFIDVPDPPVASLAGWELRPLVPAQDS